MLVRTKREPANFFTMQKASIEDESLSWKAKGMLAYLMSKPDDWTIRRSDLVKHSSDGDYAVRSALEELERAGRMDGWWTSVCTASLATKMKWYNSWDRVPRMLKEPISPCGSSTAA